jgi:D-xylono/L-arabinono-1,4-lactonase
MKRDGVQLALDLNNRCGESPRWDHRRRRLLWTDIPADTVYALDPAINQVTTVTTGLNVSGIALNRDDSLLLAGATGLHLQRADGSRSTLLAHHDDQPLVFNDILAAPNGRLYAGTLYWGADMEKPGHLYLIDPPGAMRVVDDGIELANGLALSPDNRTLYFADSAARCIFAYDVDPSSGALTRKRTFARFAIDDGIPDGLTTDAEGFIYCAMWYGAAVVRIDPEGKVQQRMPIPALQTSSVALAGDTLSDLYVTTAGEPWPSRLAPRSFDPAATRMGGGLYSVRVDVPGRMEFATAF